MAINFPSNPTNAQEVTEGNVTYVYNATKGYWESSEVSSGASIDVLADLTALIAKTGMSNGDQAFVTGNNNLYIYSGTGWYKIATVQNDSPTAITGVSGSYSLAIDGTPTVITAVSTDPDGFPLTWTYSTSGLGSIATINQVDNVFTITPSTNDANIGTFTLTINATDGVNGAVSTSTNLTLEFYITNSQYTTLLATAVDTSDNNNITDSSTNNHTITVTGDVHAGTFSPYRHGGYSTYFDGSGDYLSLATSTDFTLDGDFTIDFWVNVLDSNIGGIVSSGQSSFSGGASAIIWDHGTQVNKVSFWVDGISNNALVATNTLDLNRWYFISVVRDNGVITIYEDGASVSTHNSSSTISLSASGMRIGAYWNGQVNAYISDFRIVKGTALYTSNFTPPTERLTAVTNTSILTCHLPYIADGSTNDHSITINGDVSTKPFSPYDYEKYSATDHGGSVYFDGSGDYLTVPQDTSLELNGDFTIEGWAYISPSVGTGYNSLFSAQSSTTADRFGLTWGDSGFNYDLLLLGPTGTVVHRANVQRSSYIGQWMHFALVRISNVNKLYVDGTAVTIDGNSSLTDSSTVGASDWRIGYGTGYLHGYISDLRVIKGTGLYTSDFTPPTAPLTAITNTSLLLSDTDASIIDKSQVSNLKLVGNTTGSTTQVKFADTKSMYFDGSGDYLQTQNAYSSVGTGDFTAEAWIWINSGYSLPNPMVFASNPNGFNFGISRVGASPSTNYVLNVGHSYVGDLFIGSTTTMVPSQWYHIAVSRSSGTMYCFVDGQLEGSISDSSNFNGTINYIGAIPALTNYWWQGHIQDARFTSGLAHYTSNFTPPTEPLKG